jgi:choline dehydrogenase-like flavoprotein
MKIYDVVIIGAGLAGLQCAKLLVRCGAKILLVDRKTDLTKGIHTTGIFVRKNFGDFDFPAGTLGKPVCNVTLYSPKLKLINLTSNKDEFRVGKMGKLYQSFLQDCLENGRRVFKWNQIHFGGIGERKKRNGSQTRKRRRSV